MKKSRIARLAFAGAAALALAFGATQALAAPAAPESTGARACTDEYCRTVVCAPPARGRARTSTAVPWSATRSRASATTASASARAEADGRGDDDLHCPVKLPVNMQA
jgi:hypothetical protein